MHNIITCFLILKYTIYGLKSPYMVDIFPRKRIKYCYQIRFPEVGV